MTTVDLFPDGDQQRVLDMTRYALEADFPLAELCRQSDLKEVSERRWALSSFLAWPACGLPAEVGGADFNAADEALLFRELGGFLVSPAVMASLLAGLITLPHAVVAASQFASGERRAGLAFAAACEPDHSARSLFLLESGQATDFVWLSLSKGLFLLPRALITNIQPAQSLDPTLTLAKGSFAGDLSDADIYSGTPELGTRAQLHIAAQLVGIAGAARDMAVGHAKLREQFGQPIGAFQAVAHHCVDMELRAQAALSQMLFAAIACRDAHCDVAFQVRSALIVAADAAFRNATLNIRILGGMGYSEESGAHLYLKRSIVLRALAGVEASSRTNLSSGPERSAAKTADNDDD